MYAVSRYDSSVFGNWWWTIDRWLLIPILIIIVTGVLLIQASTPAIAVKKGWDSYYFVMRHMYALVPALIVMFGISFMSAERIKNLSLIGLLVFIPLLIATPFVGAEVKGAVRWLRIPYLPSVQVSEFVKPLFIVVSAWLFARGCERKGFPGYGTSILLYALIAGCLIAQPDVGMLGLISLVWGTQFFLAGLPMIFVVLGIGGTVLFAFVAYSSFPHFASRIDRFISGTGDTYQVDQALKAFHNGGLFGMGPGKGEVKMSIPDSHADFIFAVAGEEFGFFICLFIVICFAFIVFRGLIRIRRGNDLFLLLAGSGILIEFGLQAAINLASTMHLMPTKGMTLPFISYGGSSLMSVSISMGMLLSFTRRKFGIHEPH
ncbi:MAG: putative lipid II flippase FtsW [Alphaproteobacteria bacterium]|nr:putative lipid II flippase FtsW [Alphaproteobacteria bacterium]